MGKCSRVDRESNKIKWLKIIEEFQTSGQSQLSFCNQRNIKNSTFSYHLGLWRKISTTNTHDAAKLSFLPLEITRDKWKFNIADGLQLEIPQDVTMEQLSVFILHLRRTIC